MKLAIVSMAAVLAIAAPLPAQTDAFDGFIDSLEGRSFDLFVDAPDWKFFRTAAYCYAVEENERGTLLFGYDQRRDQVHLAFWNVNVTNYNTADTTNLELVFFTIIPGQGISAANRDWGFHKYVVATNQDGRRVFNTKLNGQAALRAFSRFDVLSIVTANGNIVQSFRLAQSSQALRRLAACRPR